jgi:hypothetical protein
VEEVGSRPARRERWIDRAIVGGFAVILAAFFADVLFGHSVLVTRDLSRYEFPLRAVLRDALQSGEFPYWNPLISAGQPLAANPAYKVFYPMQWILLLPGFVWWFHAEFLAHSVIAFAGMFLLLRSAGAGRAARTTGAVSFALSPFLLGTMDLVVYFPLAWLPWSAFVGRTFARRPTLQTAAGAAIAGAMPLLIGEPSMILQNWTVLTAFAAHAAWSRRRQLRDAALVLLPVTGVGVASLLISAVQIVPAIDFALDSVRRIPLPWDAAVEWSFPPIRLLELFVPELLGRAVEIPERYWGHIFYPGHGGPFIYSLYTGVAAALCFVVGAVSRVQYRFLALALGAISLLLALGSASPLVRLLYDAGLFGAFRYPERFILTFVFCVVFLGAVVLDAVVKGDARLARRLAIATAVALLLTLAAAAAAMLGGFPRAFSEWSGIAGSAIEVRVLRAALWTSAAHLAVFGAVLALRTRLRPQLWAVLLAGFVLLELGSVSVRYVQRLDPDFYEPPRLAAELRTAAGPVRLFHDAHFDIDAAAATPYSSIGTDAYWFFHNGLFPHFPVAYGIPTVMQHDYDLTLLRATGELFAAWWTLREEGHPHWREIFMSMSNATHVARYRDFADAVRDADSVRSIEPVVIEYAGPAPRYFFARRVIETRSLEEFISRVAQRYEAGDVHTAIPAREWGSGSVVGVRERRNAVEIDVEVGTERQALLYVSATWHKYWRATIDGNPAPIVRANVGYRGVVVPAGRHTVRMVYRNPLVVTGGVISIVALALAALALTLPLARRS